MQATLLQAKVIHADQLGFMLAMIESGIPFAPLPTAANFPTHLGRLAQYDERCSEITALHYHDRLDIHGSLLLTGNAAIDRSIHLANSRLRNAVSGPDGALG